MVDYLVYAMAGLFIFAAGWLCGFASGRKYKEPWPPDWEAFENDENHN